MLNYKNTFLKLFLLTLCITASSCGSSDDGDDFVGAAEISIRVSPSDFDTGDRTEVRINISNASDTGIAVKVFYSNLLEYVPASAYLNADGIKNNITPLYNESDGNEGTYLVFFIAIADLDNSDAGEITFQLSALDLIEKSEIQVDADIDDPLIANNIEFDPLDPKFASETSASISVKE
jgi:hypothetical protein